MLSPILFALTIRQRIVMTTPKSKECIPFRHDMVSLYVTNLNPKYHRCNKGHKSNTYPKYDVVNFT